MKNSSWGAVLAGVAAIGFLGALSGGAASAEALKIQGSAGFADEVMGPYQERIEAQSGHKLRVIANTADQGLLAVLKGECDLAMITAPLESMAALLRKSNPDLPFDRLHEFRVSKSRVAFRLNPDNPVRSVSLAKLRQVLNGQIDNWRQLGGRDLPIHVIVLRGVGGPKRATEEAILGGQRMTPHSEIIVTDGQEIARTIEQDHGAMGFTPASLAKLRRLPELQTELTITQSFSLVSRDEPTDAMRAVIAATRSLLFEDEP